MKYCGQRREQECGLWNGNKDMSSERKSLPRTYVHMILYASVGLVVVSRWQLVKKAIDS